MRHVAKITLKTKISHYLGLIIWIVPLLLFNNGQHSLMPQDEAMYAVRARWMLESGDWITPQSWGELVYEKTPGFYWLLAAFYKIFGINEVTSRLPAQIACIFSLLLTYEIAVILLNQRIAWLASAILGVSFLWLQSSRLATANTVTICVALLGFYCLLKAELNLKYHFYWSFGAGFSFALGFLIRGQLIFVPMIGLLPYLIWEHPRHRHLSNPIFYLGFVIGLIPSLTWFWLSWQRYGGIVFEQFFALAVRIASEKRNGNSCLFYLWNTPLKTFPWAFFSLWGTILILRHPIFRYRLILVGCPLVILTEISLISTRLPHYALILYPVMAMQAAIAFDWLCKIYDNKLKTKYFMSLPRNLSYIFGGLGGLIFLAAILLYTDILPITIGKDVDIRSYRQIALILGLGWLTLPLIWIARHRFGKTFLTAKYWLASWLLTAWLALAATGATGLLGNYNPDVKVFLQQRAIASILENNSINFVVQKTEALTTGGDEALLLLTFYTPHWGQRFKQIQELPAGNYAWVSPEPSVGASTSYRQLGTFRGWKLIQFENG
jgi:4-amino-4-deoxy-L-arabinose transferase-like glycosyltransferase